MPTFSDPKTLMVARVHMWVDQIVKNIESIEKDFDNGNYTKVKEALGEQYRLIFVLRDAKQGKTILKGWKTESNSTGE